jgi:poly(3-hydroxyoctanoate) depolymerase
VWRQSWLSSASLALLATPLRYYSPAFMRLIAKTLYGPTVAHDEDNLRHQIDARRARPPTLWGYAGQLTAATSWTSLPWLHRVHNPTLVMSGGSDRIVPPINARILACRIPDSRLQIVEGAGHLLLLDHAEMCATAIADFLAD